jgi:hypothetical protein
MLRRVALVRTDVWEELSASFIRVTRIGELGTTPAVTSNRRKLRRNTSRSISSSPILVTLMKGALRSSDTSVLTRTTRRNIPEDSILRAAYCLRGLIRSAGLWRLYIIITITGLYFIYRPAFHLKHKVSETGFCLRLKVDPIGRASLCRRLSSFLLRTETESSYHNAELWELYSASVYWHCQDFVRERDFSVFPYRFPNMILITHRMASMT